MTLTIVAVLMRAVSSKLFTDFRNQIEAVRLASFRLCRPTLMQLLVPEPQLRTDDRFFIIPPDSA